MTDKLADGSDRLVRLDRLLERLQLSKYSVQVFVPKAGFTRCMFVMYVVSIWNLLNDLVLDMELTNCVCVAAADQSRDEALPQNVGFVLRCLIVTQSMSKPHQREHACAHELHGSRHYLRKLTNLTSCFVAAV
jgi:hypothetical protein